MNKANVINDIIYLIGSLKLNDEQINIIKSIITMKLVDYDLVENKKLPSVELIDNDYILKRFIIDSKLKGLHDSTIRQYILTMNRVFDFTNKNYKDITGQDIMDWIAITHYQKNLSQTHRSNLCQYCRCFFKWAYNKRYINDDISRDIEQIKPKQKIKDRITDEEIELMRYCCVDNREKALLELMLATGMRVGEISKAKISDLNFEEKTILVFAEKTDRIRKINLTNRAVLALRIYIQDRPSDDYIFKALYKDNRLSNKSIEVIAKRIGERANCHLKTTVHVYRKTFGTLVNKKTGDIILTKNTLGHSNISVTEKYYIVDDFEQMRYKYDLGMN